MEKDILLYTGKLEYKGLILLFAFSGDELRLIPESEEQQRIIEYEWKMKPLREGAFTFADPTPVGDAYLVGKCNETGRKMVFYPVPGSYLSYYMSTICIPIFAYTTCRFERNNIDRIKISCPEINYIHPVQAIIDKQFDYSSFAEKGSATLTVQTFNETTTDKQPFEVDGKMVYAYFGIWRQIGGKNDEPPLSAQSSLMFEFEPTDDYSFVVRLWWIAKAFISFLCYRTNIHIPSIQLDAPYEGGKHEFFATVHFLNQEEELEKDALNAGRYIKQCYIAGSEGAILSDIANELLYTRHLPQSYRIGRKIDAARFVMLTAAFEWEFRKQYPSGIVKSKSTIDAESLVKEEIQKLVDNNTGTPKKILKRLLNIVESDSLQAEIVQVGKDYATIIDMFGVHLFKINGAELKYSEMGERLGKQRNAFAHGDLDKEFIGMSLLDLMFLEMILYAMQLRYYGIDEMPIKQAINDLFRQNMMIR